MHVHLNVRASRVTCVRRRGFLVRPTALPGLGLCFSIWQRDHHEWVTSCRRCGGCLKHLLPVADDILHDWHDTEGWALHSRHSRYSTNTTCRRGGHGPQLLRYNTEVINQSRR